jgi:hypothetical protein
VAERKVIQTSASVDFGGSVAVIARPVVFEMDDRIDDRQFEEGMVRIRKYPANSSAVPGSVQYNDNLNYEVTQGQIFFTQEVRARDVFGRVQFSGQDRVKLPYPIVSGLSMAKVGRFFDVYGQEIFPTIQVDHLASELVSSKACYGAVDYAYVTDYRILRYRPGTFLGVENVAVWNTSSYGVLVASYRIDFTIPPVPIEPLPVVIFQIQPPEGLNLEFELYRLESKVIVAESGSWERPPGWPTTGTFPDITDPNKQLDPNAPSLEVTRVHEIVHFTAQDFERKNEQASSEYFMNLPTSFRHLEKDKDVSARGIYTRIGDQVFAQWERVAPKADDYWRKIRDFKVPRTRLTRYDQKYLKPYDDQPYPNGERWLIYRSAISGIAVPAGFKIQLKVVKGRSPVASSTTRTITNRNDTQQDLQAQIANTQLARAYAAVDWKGIREMIRQSYPIQWYTVDYSEIANL